MKGSQIKVQPTEMLWVSGKTLVKVEMSGLDYGIVQEKDLNNQSKLHKTFT